MTRRQMLILAGLVVFIVLVFVTGVATRNRGENGPGARTAEELLATTTPSGEVIQETFTSEVPEAATATKPKVEIEVSAKGSESAGMLGQYDIIATGAGYSPRSLTIKAGDIVQASLTARGGRFDLFIPETGNYLSAKDGETATLSFRMPSSGTFLFECRDFCPTGKKIQGTIVVLP